MGHRTVKPLILGILLSNPPITSGIADTLPDVSVLTASVETYPGQEDYGSLHSEPTKSEPIESPARPIAPGRNDSEGITVAVDRNGLKYFSKNGKKFLPIGVNYMIEGTGVLNGKAFNTFDMFDPGIDNQNVIDQSLHNIASSGFTYVRLWLKGVNTAQGFSSTSDGGFDPKVWDAYVSKIVATVQSAKKNGLYVVLTGSSMGSGNTIFVPPNFVRSNSSQTKSPAKGINSLLLSPDMIEGLGNFYKELLRTMLAKDPDIASSIFYFDMFNEVHYDLGLPPLSQSAGTFAYTVEHGGHPITINYQLDDFSTAPRHVTSRQALMDRAALQFTASVGEKIRSVMPHVLVTMSLGSNSAMGHKEFDGGLIRPGLNPNHYSLRPYFILKGGADLTDIHIYPSPPSPSNGMIGSDRRFGPLFDSDEVVRPDVATSGTLINERKSPFIAGEFGAELDKFGVTSQSSSLFATEYTAGLTPAINELNATEAAALCKYGFSGYGFWSWDGRVSPGGTYSLVTSYDPSGRLLKAFAPRSKPVYCGDRF
jgi:hypothetical protein